MKLYKTGFVGGVDLSSTMAAVASVAWVVRRTTDDMKPISGMKVVFLHQADAEAYVDDILDGYGILYSIPLHVGRITAVRTPTATTHRIVHHSMI